MLVGTSLIIACGCVINNVIDRDIDTAMSRTRRRAMPLKLVPTRTAIAYGVALGILGFFVLARFTNPQTLILGVIGLFFYLVMYSVWKRRAPVGTIVGSISGATPIAAGYTAATGQFDSACLILFLIMVCWQMPHFYAIAMFRVKDYQAAGIPVLPVKKGFRTTKYYILAFVAAFAVAACSLTVAGYTGYIYLTAMLGLGVFWFVKGVRGFKTLNDIKWGKQMFLFSLISLLYLSAFVSIGALLP
jgi:protoheme IX farnesyltransferase